MRATFAHAHTCHVRAEIVWDRGVADFSGRHHAHQRQHKADGESDGSEHATQLTVHGDILLFARALDRGSY
jgi:hypothetical protein